MPTPMAAAAAALPSDLLPSLTTPIILPSARFAYQFLWPFRFLHFPRLNVKCGFFVGVWGAASFRIGGRCRWGTGRATSWSTFGSSTPRTARRCPARKVLPFPFDPLPVSYYLLIHKKNCAFLIVISQMIIFVHQLLHRTGGLGLWHAVFAFSNLFSTSFLICLVVSSLFWNWLGYWIMVWVVELGLVIESLWTFVNGMELLVENNM